jgi:hypothetical protein
VLRKIGAASCILAMAPAAPSFSSPEAVSPTPELRRHFDLEAPAIDAREFRSGWRVKSHLAALAEAGHIDRTQLEAGLRWRAWCETLGRQRTQSW